MKAIILNSGIGKRMGELTKDNPKCLVNIAEQENILGHQLKHLQKLGITNIIITTGPFEEQIKLFVQQKFPKLNVQYVHSDKYEFTNYIYSLHLAKNKILDNDEDLILLHGDLVFDENVLRQLIQHLSENAVLVDSSIPPPEKDFKGKIENGLVTEIGVNTFGSNCYSLAPMYKFSSQAFKLWLQEIDNFIQRGENKVYAENAFNQISSQIPLSPLFFDGNFCMEIDNLQDLEIAKEKLKTVNIQRLND